MAYNPAQDDGHRLVQGQVFAIAALLAFTIVISWRLLGGGIAPMQGFLWLGVCCICPIAWYCYGYLRITDKSQSNALLINAIGWVVVAAGFIVHYKAALEADPATPLKAIPTTSLTVLLILGLLVLVTGGLFSWQAVRNAHRSETELTS